MPQEPKGDDQAEQCERIKYGPPRGMRVDLPARLQAGAELINRTGNLTLGATNSTSAADWDFSSYRFGPNGAPGVLTLRAAGNLVLFNAISDGFTSSAYTATLLARNPRLPGNAQSWSYRLTSGADLTAANAGQVRPLAELAADSGSLLLGKNGGLHIATAPGANAATSTAVDSDSVGSSAGAGGLTDSLTGTTAGLLLLALEDQLPLE